MGTQETVIKRQHAEALEVAKRIESCLGYLSTRYAEVVGTDNSEKKMVLNALNGAMNRCMKDVLNCSVMRYTSPVGQKEGA